MKQLHITYSNDTVAAMDGMPTDFIDTDENGNRTISKSKMPRTGTYRNGTETVAIVSKLPDEDTLAAMSNFKVLGSLPIDGKGIVGGNTQADNPIVWADPTCQAIFERVTGRPSFIVDENDVSWEDPYIPCIC